MTEQLAVSRRVSMKSPGDELTVPLLYLSSADAGWEGLVAEAFYEPVQLEGWVTPVRTGISLVQFRGGAMRIEQRSPNGAWEAYSARQGDLSLRPGVGTTYEVRWKSISSAPTRTLHLHLSDDVVARTAEEVAGYDPAQLTLVERAGFRDPLLEQIGLALWGELEQEAPAGQLYAQSAAQMLAVHLLRHYTAEGRVIREPPGRLMPQQMRRVTDFVQGHLNQNLTLDVLAQQVGFSAYYFARLFRRTTGESPHQFVLRRRTERALRLLEDP
ncbi:MAG: AraC family transcriptional regulator, partial [Ktedonobacterales bacterium]